MGIELVVFMKYLFNSSQLSESINVTSSVKRINLLADISIKLVASQSRPIFVVEVKRFCANISPEVIKI